MTTDHADETAAMPTAAVPVVDAGTAAQSDQPGRTGIMSKTPVRIAVWAVAAVLAIGAAAAAVAATVGGGDILSADDVAAQLGTGGPGAAGSGDAGPGDEQLDPGGSAAPGTLVGTPGGTLVVQCQGDLASLLSWSPKPGFRADDVVRGPAASAGLWFESDSDNDVKVEFTCSAGEPMAHIRVEEDNHGGRGHDGGGSGGGGSGPG